MKFTVDSEPSKEMNRIDCALHRGSDGGLIGMPLVVGVDDKRGRGSLPLHHGRRGFPPFLRRPVIVA